MKINSNPILYVHIGYQRAASSFLQEKVFSKQKSINYFGKTEDNYPDWLIKWRYLDDYAFNKKYKYIKDKIFSNYDVDKVNLVSSESFIKTGGEIHNQAQRIKKVSPNSRIIVVLRDPIDYILSFYKYIVEHNGFLLDLEECIDWSRTPFVFYKRKPIYLPDLYYNETIDTYETTFGKSNVCVLKYEDMINKSDVYFKKLESFLKIKIDLVQIKRCLNIRINASKSAEITNHLRAKNIFNFLKRYFPTLLNKVDMDEIMDEIEKNTKNEILKDDLKNRLKEYFSGKCHGYY